MSPPREHGRTLSEVKDALGFTRRMSGPEMSLEALKKPLAWFAKASSSKFGKPSLVVLKILDEDWNKTGKKRATSSVVRADTGTSECWTMLSQGTTRSQDPGGGSGFRFLKMHALRPRTPLNDGKSARLGIQGPQTRPLWT